MSVREEIRRLINTESAQHKRLIEYVVRQLGAGRKLDDVLNDPYVTNRSSTIDRRALLEEPEVVDAAGEGQLSAMRGALEAELGT
jgi:hypothetical protein